MSVLGFVFLIIITAIINVFITAFLIARSQYSQKVLHRLRSEVHSIIRTVNKATEEHVSIAESTIADLKTLLSKQKRSSRTKRIQIPKVQKSQQLTPNTALSPSTQRVKKSNTTSTKKTISSQSPTSVQIAIIAMLEDGKSEAYIREHLTISKAELTLAKFIHKSRK